jgi:hypothetical protein
VTVPVQAGATTASVTATGAAVGSTTISASFGGQTVALSLIVQPLPVLTGQLVLNPGSVFIGGASTGTVTISGPAPQQGLVVSLATSNPVVASLSSGSITVPAGGTTATFTVEGANAGSATISATAGVTLSALFTVVKPKGKEFEKVHADKIAEKAIPVETLPKVKLSDRVLSGSASATSVHVSSVDDSSSVAKGAAFIRLDERPPVGDAVLCPLAEDEQQKPNAIGGQATTDQASFPQKSLEKPPTAEKGIIAERLGDRPIH